MGLSARPDPPRLYADTATASRTAATASSALAVATTALAVATTALAVTTAAAPASGAAVHASAAAPTSGAARTTRADSATWLMLDAAPAGLSVCGWQQLRSLWRTPVLPATRVEP